MHSLASTFRFECEDCGVVCTSQHTYASHLAGKRHRISQRKKLPTFCVVCSRECSNPENLASHLRGQQHRQNLAEQPKIEQDAKPLVASRAPVNESTGCELCQIILPSVARRAAHERSSNHQRRLRFKIYQKEIAASESSKHGVSLGPGVDFGVIDYSLDAKGDDDGIYTALLTCHNTVLDPVLISSVDDMRSKHKAYSQPFEFRGTPTVVPARGKSNIVISFNLTDRSAVGIYETRIRVNFQHGSTDKPFTISRSVRAVVGNKEELGSLKPIAPYVPKAKPSPESFVSKETVIEGEKPPALSEINWVNPLPRFDIPSRISTEIARYADESFKEQIKGLRKLVPGAWDSISYRSKFQNLLWMEEDRQAKDVRQYDIENAHLKRSISGPYFTYILIYLNRLVELINNLVWKFLVCQRIDHP